MSEMSAVFTCSVCQSSLVTIVRERGSEPPVTIFGPRVALAFGDDGRCLAVCGTCGMIASLVVTDEICRQLQDAWRRKQRRQ